MAGRFGPTRAIAVFAAALLCAAAGAEQGRIGPPADPLPTESVEGRAIGPRTSPPAGDAAAPAKPVTAPGGLTRTVLSLVGVVSLIIVLGAVARQVARRRGGLGGALGAGGRAPSGVLEILGRYPVPRGGSLVLLKLDRRVLLLSQSSGGRLGAGAGFSTLAEITDPEEVASILVKSRDDDGETMAARFSSMLGRFDRGMAEAEAPGRRVSAGPGGDRAELWDASRGDIPVVDLTGGPAQGGAIGSLRKRLAAFRGGAA